MVKFDKKYVTEKIIERYPDLNDLGNIEKIEPTKENVYSNAICEVVRYVARAILKELSA